MNIELGKNINPRSLSLDEKLQAAWDWNADKGGQIMNQLHILGDGLDFVVQQQNIQG